jgi:hypothetical protein
MLVSVNDLLLFIIIIVICHSAPFTYLDHRQQMTDHPRKISFECINWMK